MDAYKTAYELQIAHKDIVTEYGTLKFLSFGTRYGYYIIPKPRMWSETEHPELKHVLFFYHGSRSIALEKALINTNLIKLASEYNMIIFFGQADGVIKTPEIHPIYNNITFGEVYWGIKSSQNMSSDIKYTSDVIDYFKAHYNSDCFYYMGHSNGGVFALLLSVWLPNSFRAIVSHKGGLGYDNLFYLDFDQLNPSDRRTPILFFTSEHDIHRPVCKQAHELFSNMDFSSTLMMVPHDGHEYNQKYERTILDWLIKNI